MKNCPQCGKTFSDDYNFCLDDGITLIYEADSEKTIPFNYQPTDEKISSSEKTIPFTYNSDKNPVSSPIKTVNKSSKYLYLIIGVLAIALAAAAILFFVQSRSSENNLDAILSPGGDWAGDWNTENSYFTATANFTDKNGDVSGRIVWTLQRTTKPEKLPNIGTSAVEYVAGKFDSETKLLNLTGLRKDDPNNLVILDKYTLSLAEDNKTLIGKSINGTFVLKK